MTKISGFGLVSKGFGPGKHQKTVVFGVSRAGKSVILDRVLVGNLAEMTKMSEMCLK